jgi:type 1 glutamine amidotransferase/HEAT repeat protein
MKHTFFGYLVSFVILASAPLLAVTDEEVQKMIQAMPDKPLAKPAAERTLLVFNLSNGYKHSSIPYWQKALDIMSQKTGAFRVVHSSDMAIFTEEALKPIDAICFNNTTGLTPDAAQQKAIMDFITSGKGIIGIHAATDNFNNWPEGMMMMGGVFKGHPWGGGGTWAVKIDDPQHPLMASFEGKGFKVNDEIYRTLPPQYSRSSQRVLMSLDMSDSVTRNAEGVTPEDMDTGLSWIKPVGKGRLFYGSLGHNHHLTWTTPLLVHYLGGIQYALGDLKVDDSPVKMASIDADKVKTLVDQIRRYELDQSRTPLAEFEALVRDFAGEPAARKVLESNLLEALQSESTLAAKDFCCRMLSIIGTEDSVPALAKLLSDQATFDMARYSLDRISGPKAEAALLEALAAAKEAGQKAGLMTSLGVRKSQLAVAVLSKAINDGDSLTAQAAIEALALIGTEQAAKSLQEAVVTDAVLKNRIHDALLQCAGVLCKAGKTQAAQVIYKDLYSGNASSVVKAGALIGLAQTNDSQMRTYVHSALSGEDVSLREAAVKVIAQTADKKLLEEAAAMAEKLAPQAQIQMVTALSENPLRIGTASAERLAGSSEKDVRKAAYQALAVLGNEKSAILLARGAASETDRNERQAAQQALYILPGESVDQAILAAVGDDRLDEPVRLEMIQAAVQRQSNGSVQVLLQSAQSQNQKVAAQSIRALQSLAGAEDAEAMVELVIKRPGSNTENALTAAAMKIQDKDQRAGALLVRYPKVRESEAKASLLRVMGKLGDKHTVDVLSRELTSTDPIVSDAAFRAMSDWPGMEFTAKMKEMAQSTDLKTKVLAFRAYVRMLGTDSAALMEAYALAQRPDEQKIVIGALADTGSLPVLAFLEKLSADPQLKTESQLSLVSVCEKLVNTNTDQVKPILNTLAQQGSNDAVKKRASELLAKLN